MARKTAQTKFVPGNIARVDVMTLKRRVAAKFMSAVLPQWAAIFGLAWCHIENGPARKVLTTRMHAWDYLRDLLVAAPRHSRLARMSGQLRKRSPDVTPVIACLASRHPQRASVGCFYGRT